MEMISSGRSGQSESRKKEIYEGVQSKACSGIYCSPVQEKDRTVTCGSKADKVWKDSNRKCFKRWWMAAEINMALNSLRMIQRMHLPYIDIQELIRTYYEFTSTSGRPSQMLTTWNLMKLTWSMEKTWPYCGQSSGCQSAPGTPEDAQTPGDPQGQTIFITTLGCYLPFILYWHLH